VIDKTKGRRQRFATDALTPHGRAGIGPWLFRLSKSLNTLKMLSFTPV
jgi:hypothetical protein